MTNIPRRKIYEKMLEYEDIILEMHVLLLSSENFEKFKEKFNLKIPELKLIFEEIKVLFVLFLKNEKFESEKDFQNCIRIMLDNKEKTNEEILNNKNLFAKFRENIKFLNKEFETIKEIESLEKGRELFTHLDIFNSYIPKTLEIRRDKMKK